jgi:hypothetical protein
VLRCDASSKRRGVRKAGLGAAADPRAVRWADVALVVAGRRLQPIESPRPVHRPSFIHSQHYEPRASGVIQCGSSLRSCGPAEFLRLPKKSENPTDWWGLLSSGPLTPGASQPHQQASLAPGVI